MCECSVCMCVDHGGKSALRKVETIKEEDEDNEEGVATDFHIGAFHDPAAQNVLDKAKTVKRLLIL